MSCTSQFSQPFAGRTPGRRVLVNRGFTLVELLVVIGIIAVLIAILMPTLSRVRHHAISTQCQSNLRTIGQTAFIYAAENHGWLPPAQVDSIEIITGGGMIANPGGTPSPAPSHQMKQQWFKLLSGNTIVFYCPANDLWEGETATTTTATTPPLVLPQHDPARFEQVPVFADTSGVRIRYWWMGNPWRPSGPNVVAGDIPTASPKGYRQWIDADNDGETRDEYMCRINEKKADEIVIATDQTRQVGGGWTFFHGTRRNVTPGEANHAENAARMQSSWKNNLYGDGHVERKRPDEIKLRYAPTNPAAW
jgi:prepilin-type N-terminal cleavage/methylation domain-containing protein